MSSFSLSIDNEILSFFHLYVSCDEATGFSSRQGALSGLPLQDLAYQPGMQSSTHCHDPRLNDKGCYSNLQGSMGTMKRSSIDMGNFHTATDLRVATLSVKNVLTVMDLWYESGFKSEAVINGALQQNVETGPTNSHLCPNSMMAHEDLPTLKIGPRCHKIHPYIFGQCPSTWPAI
eukprot:Protomagalhaensia_wolfi_Nauph_80__2924@NODE_3001_length_921_cov_21_358277_g2349_i0_p1_GENE_NODE_3001_length_921_cov_21_358277_g2349_i0NODE_3001_length_921_cov_21_358277_g2349_i0_p1_ORF_typecomplete_len176_score16_40_NODE_3001_length_921_cov_21_358277_g2349_i0117644